MIGFVLLVLLFSTPVCLSALPEPENCTVKENLPCKLYRITNVHKREERVSYTKNNTPFLRSPGSHYPLEWKARNRYRKENANSHSDCSPPSLQQSFPDIYVSTDLNPPRAYKFNYTLFYKVYEKNNRTYPGVNLWFTPPADGGITFVKGFEVTRYKPPDNNQVQCYIFDLSAANWSAANDKDVIFNLTIHPMLAETEYISELYTLPKPRPIYDQYRRVSYNAPAYVEPTPGTPSNWRTSFTKIDVLPNDGAINVQFESAPQEYGFTEYRVNLVDTQTNRIKDTTTVTTPSHMFKNVSHGVYQIEVRAIQPGTSCICKPDCVCLSSLSWNIIMPEITTPTTQTPMKTSLTDRQTSVKATDEPPSSSRLMDGNDEGVSTGKVLAAVFGSIVGVMLIAVILAVVYCYRCKPEIYNMTKKDLNDNDNCAYDDPDYSSVVTVDVVKKGGNLDKLNNPNAQKIQFDQRKKIFLLYEEDHQYHRKVVDKFAMYLSNHCQCDVEQAELHHDAPWVHQDLARADYVIFVNSEAAFKAAMLANARKNCGKNNSISSINSIRNKLTEGRYDHMIMVYFSYTDEKFILPDICTGYKYKLMKHFNDFLLYIHKLQRTDNLSRYDLPFDGNHNLRPIGQELLNAIDIATKYESENPNWFIQLHGMTRGISNTSEESRLQSGDSGCPDDYTPGQTPVSNSINPWLGSNLPEELLRRMDTKSIITVTQSDLNVEGQIPKPSIQKQRPSLKIPPMNSYYQEIQEEPSVFTPPTKSPHVFTPPTDSPIYDGYDFIPPDLNSNFDGISTTQSKQLEGIVDRYRETLWDLERSKEVKGQGGMTEGQGHYDKDADLAILDAHSREVMFNSAMEAETISLGGESI